MRMRLFHAVVLAFSGLMFSDAARSATATTTFPVSATVLKVCLISANPLDFASYDPTSATNLDQSTTLSILCTVGTSFTVGLNAGATSGTTVTTRKMANGSDRLNYSLYQESARTNNWGNTPGTDTPAAIIAPTTASTLTVYGRVPAGQNVPIGTYTDTVTLTVNY